MNLNQLIVGKIASYTYNEYNKAGGELRVIRRYDNIDVSDCLTMAGIQHKIKQRHDMNGPAVNPEWRNLVQYSDYVVLSIMEINQ